MSEAAAAESPKVMEKVFNILKRELSAEEYLIYLQAITPRIGDATAQLRDITKKMSLEDVLRRARRIEKTIKA
ncbi:MAG: hypothetical protein WA102_10785 [Candidatus Methanoperedens sp.]|jgi:hypothetical protein